MSVTYQPTILSDYISESSKGKMDNGGFLCEHSSEGENNTNVAYLKKTVLLICLNSTVEMHGYTTLLVCCMDTELLYIKPICILLCLLPALAL
jgi:hypothetical protein